MFEAFSHRKPAQAQAHAGPRAGRAVVIGGPLERALTRPEIALPVALGLIALIGVADYITGYEVRLAVLYIVPIALATRVCGSAWESRWHCSVP